MERERPHEPVDRGGSPEREAPALRIAVQRREGASRSRLQLAVMAALSVAGFVLFARLGRDAPLAAGLSLGVGVALAIDVLLLGPVFALASRLAAESARLRAALACPFCKDALPEDAAVACDRKGCGAFYHPECWAECRATYGGCAIYGCACTTGHQVGRFALRHHVLRLLVAAAFFPPTLVKRLKETERQSFREVWRQARSFQATVTMSAPKTCLMGMANLVLSVATIAAVALAIALSVELRLVSKPSTTVILMIGTVLVIGAPVAFMRLPLLTHFGFGFARLVARVFRDELGALGRADEGTFLARLAGGAGKKDG